MRTAIGTRPSANGPGARRPRPVVLQSIRQVRPTTNPYVVQLLQGLEPEAEVCTFTWPRALLGRWDVLHLHWPEVVFRRAGTVRTWVGMLLFLLLMVRVRVRRKALVRTVHNLEPHEAGPAVERRLLALCDRWTTLRISLHEAFDLAGDVPTVVVPHGDYAGWYAGQVVPPVVPGRVLTFGLVRPYKGIEELIDTFRRAGAPDASLHVVGKPADPATAAAVRAAAGDDRRVTLTLEHVPDDVLAREVGEAELVVLPYRAMQNSGAALMALSLGRPVLVPDNALNAALAREVGEAWVQRFRDRLTAQDLDRALAAGRGRPATSSPDLSGRDWATVTAAHLDAYRLAMTLAGAGRQAGAATSAGREDG